MSSQLTQRGSLDAESEMSPQEPPPWIVRTTAWILVGAFLFALLIAIVMRLPETVHCPFILIPATGADPIQSPRQAIISRVAVEEGQPVKAGEDLFILRSDEIRGWDTQFRTLTEDLRNKEESLTQYETAYVSQLEIKKAEIEQAKSEVKFRENHAATSRDLVTRMEKLAKQGGESEIDLVKLKLDLAGSEKDLSVAQRTLQQVKLDRERMETEHASTGRATVGNREIKNADWRSENRPGKYPAELADSSESLRRRDHFNGSTHRRQFCAAGTSALPARTERCETAGSDDLKRSWPPETRHRSARAVFLRSIPLPALRCCNRKTRLDQSVSCY